MKKSIFLLFLFCVTPFLRAEEPFVIGQLGSEGELFFPRQVIEGPDGNIYVYDQMDAFIKIFNGEGKFLRKIGGKGQGPGEIQRNDGVFFGFFLDGNLFFTEFFGGHPWITVLETSGDLVRTIQLDIQRRFGIQKAYALPDGRFIVQFVYIAQPEQKKDYFLHKTQLEIALLDLEGNVQSSFLRQEISRGISLLDQGGDTSLPFTPRYLWTLHADHTIVFADGLSASLQVYDLNGKKEKFIDTSLPQPEKVTKKDLDNWKKRHKEMIMARNPDWYNRLGKVIESYKKSIYDLKPVLNGLDGTPDGNFLLTGLQDEERGIQTYWLFDAGGKELVKIETEFLIGQLSKNFVVYASIDKDSAVSLFAFRRKGNEKEDLLRIPKVKLNRSNLGKEHRFNCLSEFYLIRSHFFRSPSKINFSQIYE